MTLTARASEASARIRADRTRYRDQVANRAITLRELLLADEIPEPVATVRAFQVVTWPFHKSLSSSRHSPVRTWLQRLNYDAMRNAVNLFEEIGRLNPRQREWLVTYVEQHPVSWRYVQEDAA